MTTIHHRPYAGPADIPAVTNFLLETYALNGTLHNWEPRRWHGQIYHNNTADFAAYQERLPREVHLWHDAQGAIRGVLIPERPGSVFPQIHPAHRDLEHAMLDRAEANLMQRSETGEHWLSVWAYDYDDHRSTLLRERGYTRTEAHEILRRRPLSLHIPRPTVPEGYRVRAMRRHPDDWQSQAALLNAAFNRDFHSADEYRTFQTSPLYRAELDIVVEAPDGSLAANVGLMAHERESFAVVEPVCTHPAHQGKGLAGAAMAEGLQRVQALGVEVAWVGAWYSNPVSNHLYEKMGFTDPARHYLWRLERR